jgi:mycofactocin precursor
MEQTLDRTEADEATATDVTAEVEADDELLVEEISIDGMCGVY